MTMSTVSSRTTASLVTRILHLPITSDAEAFVTVAQATERVVVRLTPPGAEHRGNLEGFVVHAIELTLGRLGAAPPGHTRGDAIEAVLADQLYRARLLGCFGLALSFAPFEGLADEQGQLGERDSATLRRLVALAEREPLQLYLPRPCTELHVVGSPEPLSAWLPPALEPGAFASIEYDLQDDADGEPESEEPLEGTPLVAPQIEAFVDAGPVEPDESARPSSHEPSVSASQEQVSFGSDAPESDIEHFETRDFDAPESDIEHFDARDFDAPESDIEHFDARDFDAPDSEIPDFEFPDTAAADTPASVALPAGPAASDDDPTADEEVDETPEHTGTIAAKAPAIEEPSADVVMSAGVTPQPAQVEAGATPDELLALAAERARRCLAWAAQLQGMSGPKAHGSVEKAFITAYLPLCREIAAGAAPDEARAAAERWAEGFAQSYASAYRMLHTRTRRPLMVRDVVDLGFRWMGQHPARQCQLLLVSAMRFDLGQRLNEEIERRFRGGATCTEQSILWTALPSNAEAQQLVSAEALFGRRIETAPRVVPAYDAAQIQPFVVGNRELSRLSLVLDDLPRAGEAEGARLERLAVRLADSIVPWMQRQPPETLIVLFGDHGFHWESTPSATSAAQRGGALPEQVLVPASAWLARAPRQQARVAPGVH
jgi:hypothetical protein